MALAHKNISRSLDKLFMEVARSDKPIVVHNFHGETVVVDARYVRALRDREDAHCLREARGTKKKPAVTQAQRDKTVDDLVAKVDTSMQKAAGVKVSAPLRKIIVDQVRHSLVNRKETPKSTTFVPRLLYYLDDHLADFLKGIKLGLLSSNFKGTAAQRAELTSLEESLVEHLRAKRVGASTVVNALVVFFTNTHDLRPKKGGTDASMIKMDSTLKALLDAPMDSRFKGDSLAGSYSATAEMKTLRNGSKVQSLAGYRMKNPSRSVREYLKASSSAEEVKHLNNGFLMSKHIMSLVSAHLIPASSFKACDHPALSMEMRDGAYTNPNVYTLISLQAIITASHEEDSKPDVKARSPSKSPSRAATRTPSKTPSREPSRAVSRGRARAPSPK
jgi:hypothetical protein